MPRVRFVTAMAGELFRASELYTPRKLDDPDKLRIFCSRAEEAVKLLPPSKETEELEKKITAAMKKAKAS